VVAGSWSNELSVIDTARGTLDEMIKPGGQFPVWSPNGHEVGFMGADPPPAATAQVSVIRAPVGGRGRPESITSSSAKWQWPIGWTSDEHSLVWIGTSWDIWFSPPGHQDLAKPFLQTGRNPEGRLSPNGEWIAYASDPDDSGEGKFQIVIQRFPQAGPRY